MKRYERQNMIRKLIQEREIASQEELLSLLGKKGVEVTQPTLSRDLMELGVAKVGGCYAIDKTEDSYVSTVGKLLPLEILDVLHNEAVIVIKTMTGRASGVAWYIDNLELPDIMGTIAGDDQILVIPKSVKKVEALVKQLKQLQESR